MEAVFAVVLGVIAVAVWKRWAANPWPERKPPITPPSDEREKPEWYW